MNDDIHDRIAQTRQLADEALRTLALGMLAACPGPHNFVQHRDRLPPWCEACGYATTGERVRAAEMGA